MICADPERKLIAILLTNRVYPFDTPGAIHNARQDFSIAVQEVFDSL